MNGPVTRRVNLPEPIRVMILYATAVANEAGEVYFFDDLYGHDAHLESVLGLKPIRSAPGRSGQFGSPRPRGIAR